MAGRRYYQSKFFVTGVILLVLGIGNAALGSRKLAQYEAVVAAGRARGYLAEADATRRILQPIDDEGERYNIARAKVDLYHVVLSGGLLMLGAGAILTIAAWVRIRIRGDERDALPAASPAHYGRRAGA